MSFFKGLRFKKMLDEILASDTPEDIHDLFTEFLDGEFETEGRTKYRALDVKYYVGYTVDNREIIFEITADDRLDAKNDDPVLMIKMRLKRDAMSYLHKDLKTMINLLH